MVETACTFLAKGSLNTPRVIPEEGDKAGLRSSHDCLQLFAIF